MENKKTKKQKIDQQADRGLGLLELFGPPPA
jgi:hypothetical protein